MSSKVNYEGGNYSKFRPTYSDRLYSLIYDFHKGSYDQALDMGTGTGQGAIELANRFKQVYGVDPLPEMVNNAIPRENVIYSVGSAEFLDFPDNSIDMVTVATAFHWFDHAKFFDQVKRVLKPDGTLAVWGYYFPMVKNNPAVNDILSQITGQNGVLKPYTDPNTKYIINMYRDFTFPFKTVDYYISPSSNDTTGISKPCGGALMEKTMSLSDFEKYIKTASAYVKYKEDREKGGAAATEVDIVEEYIEKIAQVMHSEDKEKTMVDLEWPMVLVLCRNC